MNVLGAYWGIPSTVCLFQDGRIRSAVSEERFTRLKNDDAFPVESLRYSLKEAGLSPKDLDGLAIASYIQGLPFTILRTAHWSIADYVLEQKLKWYPTLYEGKEVSELDVFADKIDWDMYPKNYWKKSIEGLKEQSLHFPKDREGIFAEHLGIEPEKVRRIYHHKAHGYYAYYSSPFRGEPVLSLTIDGWGDDKNAMIAVFDSDGSYREVFGTANCNIGRIYRYITLLLGMKPNEHEFKVMGLAAYAKPKIMERALQVFKSTLYVGGLDFKWKEKPTDSYFWFKERLEGCRFDGIAGALQKWTEDLLVEWVRNAVREFGIDTIVLSGGVAMNVKANGKIAELPEVQKLFVGGSSTDESLAIGSAIVLAEDLSRERKQTWSASKVPYLESLYLGPEASKKEEQEALSSLLPQQKEEVAIIEDFSEETLVELLASGKTVARCVGRMEFGQRSLCNRAILADPVDRDIVARINEAIKNRDFWMPFAPVVLDSYADRYLLNPKGLQSPHMSIGFATTEEGWKAMPAACHPADRSARAQILTKTANPKMYRLLEAFAKKTGRGALLNTSFNLHGFPIVNTPDEALYVFFHSGLDALLLNHFLVTKK